MIEGRRFLVGNRELLAAVLPLIRIQRVPRGLSLLCKERFELFLEPRFQPRLDVERIEVSFASLPAAPPRDDFRDSSAAIRSMKVMRSRSSVGGRAAVDRDPRLGDRPARRLGGRR